MDHVYAVTAESGEYDDYSWWVEGVFDCHEKAVEHIESLGAEKWSQDTDLRQIWRKRSRPSSFDTYYEIEHWEINKPLRED